jgi:hypothetical protein
VEGKYQRVFFLFRLFEGVGDGSPVAWRSGRRRGGKKAGRERSGVESQGSIDIYVGVVLENEENVVVVGADTNVMRDAEPYEERRGEGSEDRLRRNNFELENL